MCVAFTDPVSDDDLPLLFAPSLTAEEHAVLKNILLHLTDALDAAGITYYMCGGTLIGSYRHHGHVPWDDDSDIYVRWSDSSRIASVIRDRMPDYELANLSTFWKIYSRNESTFVQGYSW